MTGPTDDDNSNLRVLLVDDNEPFRRRVLRLLSRTAEFDIIGEAGDGETAVRLARELQPDAIVIDIVMPVLNGIEATRRIKREFPAIEVIALSMYSDDGFTSSMRKAGATRYVLKDNVLHDLPPALRTIAARLVARPPTQPTH